MKDEKLALEEKFKALGKSHKAKLENLRYSHYETFKKYQEDTQKNLIEVFPKWNSNLILHAQVATGPIDFRRVDFDCLKDFFTSSLKFDVYHLEVEERETFQWERKQ